MSRVNMLMDFAVLLDREFQVPSGREVKWYNLKIWPRNLRPAAFTILFNGKPHVDFSGVKNIP